MAMRYGKCANFGLCPKADARETQAVPDGADFACQNAECKRLLTGTHSASLGRSGSNRTALFVSAAVLVIAGVAVVKLFAGSRVSGPVAAA